MKAFLVELIVAFAMKIIEKLKPSMVEGVGPGKKEKRLRDQIKKDGWK